MCELHCLMCQEDYLKEQEGKNMSWTFLLHFWLWHGPGAVPYNQDRLLKNTTFTIRWCLSRQPPEMSFSLSPAITDESKSNFQSISSLQDVCAGAPLIEIVHGRTAGSVFFTREQVSSGHQWNWRISWMTVDVSSKQLELQFPTSKSSQFQLKVRWKTSSTINHTLLVFIHFPGD